MTKLQIIVTVIVFGGVILAIAFDLIEMMLAALLGVSVLTLFGIFSRDDILDITGMAAGPIALLFGGMVVVVTLAPTGIFDYIGTRYLMATGGSGKRFLLGLLLLIAPLCAVLPNATTVILLAPIIIRVANALEVDFVGPMVLTAVISNSAGMLTLVGDPATFLVGSEVGMSFMQYLRRVSPGALLTILVILPLIPRLFKDTWQIQRTLPDDLKPEPLKDPVYAAVSIVVLVMMVLLFLFGEKMPFRLLPPGASIIAASLALLVLHGIRHETVDSVLKKIDWRTLIFLICMFSMVEALKQTEMLSSLSLNLYAWFGGSLLIVAFIMLGGTATLSSLLANIPVVGAMIFLGKGYLVTAEIVPEMALAHNFADWPPQSLPVFVALMFAGTLGGNATLIGASANVVSAGICASQGKPVSFLRFARYGLPITICQLAVSAVYVVFVYATAGR
jgi:Na+/H+ antiporter NhaD/arsenite permease-like protein